MGDKTIKAVQKKDLKHIAIAGNIGAGKTTLATLLAERFDWTVHYEDVANNPYLEDFYQDMQRWSFNLQIYFLNSRFKQILDIQNGDHTVIQDRTIFEDAKIFAPNLHHMGLMTLRDYTNYNSLFETISSMFNPPDLLIYLKASIDTLVNQIQKRGREYEESIRTDYLRGLNEYYEEWIESYDLGPLLIVEVDKYNFADKPEDLDVISNIIAQRLADLGFASDQKVL